MSDQVIEELKQAFREKRDLYDAFGAKVLATIKNILEAEDIKVLDATCRTKTLESFDGKIERPEKQGKYSQLPDITDLCGVRIVAFTVSDCDKICTVIRQHFLIDEGNSIDKLDSADDDRFGYLSQHLVLSLADDRAGLVENKRFVDLKVEVQVRTVLQHAWADLDWRIRYKSAVEIPKEIRRKLFRVSALLEAADETFSEVQASTVSIRQRYREEVEAGNFVAPIDRDSLEAFLGNSSALKHSLTLAISSGLPIKQDIQTNSESAWTYLIRSLLACNIGTVEEIETRLTAVSQAEIDVVARVLSKWSGKNLGIFSFLRILMIAQLPHQRRLEVAALVPSSGDLGVAEAAAYSSN